MDTCLTCIHFPILAASNVSDVLKKSDSSCKVKGWTVNPPVWGTYSCGSEYNGSELEETFKDTLLILPAMPCAESGSSLSFLASSSSFLAQPTYSRVRASNKGSGCECFIPMKAAEVETLAVRDAVRENNWAVTCFAKGWWEESLLCCCTPN